MNGVLINEKSQENHYVNNSKRSKDMVVSLLDDTEYRFDVEVCFFRIYSFFSLKYVVCVLVNMLLT